MTIRAIGALLCGAILAFAAPTDLAQAQSTSRATTVKSSKSNASDRAGQTTPRGTAKATTVKSSKSNQSDRAGSVKGSSAPAGTNLNSSRSN
jgi:hypothetical protein